MLTLFASAPPGLEIKLEVKRKAGGKTEVLTAKLAEMPEGIPDKLPALASAKKALAKPGMPMPMPMPKKDEEKKAETGLLKRTTAAADHTYYIYVPENYDPNIAYSLVIWFHPPNKGKEKDLDNFTWNFWDTYCLDQKTIVLCPVAENQNTWTPSEAEFIQEAVKAVADAYTIDRRRVVAHGMGVGGQMAIYLGFHNRGLVRGVATVARGADVSTPRKSWPTSRCRSSWPSAPRTPFSPPSRNPRPNSPSSSTPCTRRQCPMSATNTSTTRPWTSWSAGSTAWTGFEAGALRAFQGCRSSRGVVGSSSKRRSKKYSVLSTRY